MLSENQIKELLAKYFISPTEYKCHHCKKYPPSLIDVDWNDFSFNFRLLFSVFREIRERFGKPINITSGYRCKEYEQKMYGQAVLDQQTPFPDGKAFVSAHLFGLALDLESKNYENQKAIVEIARKIKPRPRIGWKIYKKQGKSLVHIDLAYLINPKYEDLSENDEW